MVQQYIAARIQVFFQKAFIQNVNTSQYKN